MLSSKTIISNLYDDPRIAEILNNIIKKNHREDFKSHLFLQLLNADKKKIISSYYKNEIYFYVTRIILNQYQSKTSSWFKDNNMGFYKDTLIISEFTFEPPIPNENPINEFNKENVDITLLKSQIDVILKNRNKPFLFKHRAETYFKLYFYQKKTLKEISSITDTNYVTIFNSIKDTLIYIKKNINTDDFINNNNNPY
jgi:hypothetical protein